MARPLGPYPLPGEELLPPGDELIPKDSSSLGLQVDRDQVMGILAPFNGRARRYLAASLRGASRGMAAAAAGVDLNTIQGWELKHTAFRQAAVDASNLGFATVVERELYSRAFAGAEDRGSMRALELVTKARSPEYREKSQVQMDVIHRAGAALGALTSGWDGNDSAASLPSIEGEARVIVEGEATDS